MQMMDAPVRQHPVQGLLAPAATSGSRARWHERRIRRPAQMRLQVLALITLADKGAKLRPELRLGVACDHLSRPMNSPRLRKGMAAPPVPVNVQQLSQRLASKLPARAGWHPRESVSTNRVFDTVSQTVVWAATHRSELLPFS
jgi:hypothetical protein